MSHNRIVAALAVAFSLLAGQAVAACNPPQSPPGSIGCQPALSPVQAGDLVLAWKPSTFPASTGTYTMSQLAAFFAATGGGVLGPGASTVNHVALWNNGTGTLLKDGGALALIATSGLITDAGGTLAVGHGGTGATTFTLHGIVLGQTTAAMHVTAAMTDGQLLVGQTSADPLPKTISGNGSLAADGTLTISITGSAFGSQSQNTVLAAPNGSSGTPTFRALVSADLPSPIGTSGAAIPLLNGTNAWSGVQAFGTTLSTMTTQSGTTYTLAATDCGTTVKFTSGSAITLTTLNSLTIGCYINVLQAGAGQITVANGSGATLQSSHGYTKTFGQWAMIGLFVDANSGGTAAEFVFYGDGA